jgi:hypothetical protein
MHRENVKQAALLAIAKRQAADAIRRWRRQCRRLLLWTFLMGAAFYGVAFWVGGMLLR